MKTKKCINCGRDFDGSLSGWSLCPRCLCLLDEDNEDPLAGDVDYWVEPEIEVSYPGPNGPEYVREPIRLIHTCYYCGEELEPIDGRLCAECRDEFGTN